MWRAPLSVWDADQSCSLAAFVEEKTAIDANAENRSMASASAKKMPAPVPQSPRAQPSRFVERFQDLRVAVEAELQHKRTSDELAAACKALTPRAASLASLAQALLSGAPYRLLRDAVSLTAAAVDARVGIASGSDVCAGELFRAAPRLWQEGLSIPNREVRVHVLSLFIALAPAWTAASSGLLVDDLNALAKGAAARAAYRRSEARHQATLPPRERPPRPLLSF